MPTTPQPITTADLTPGVRLAPRDHEQPDVTIVARTAQGGVRFTIGEQHGWHCRADRLAVALAASGYEVAA